MTALVPSAPDRLHPQVDIDDKIEQAAGTPAIPHPDSSLRPVTIHSRFLASPCHAAEWVEICASLESLALASPASRHFRVARDWNDAMYFDLCSEWDGPLSHLKFEQQEEVKGIEQNLAAISFLEEARVFRLV